MKDHDRLTTEEQEIENALDISTVRHPSPKAHVEQKLQEAAKNYQKKDTRINIRLSRTDVEKLKRKAVREGLPYQTMIAGILHRVANGLRGEERK